MKQVRQKSRTIRLSKREAVAKIDAMYPLILRDIGIAVAEYGALEGANKVAMGEMKGVNFAGADCYNLVQQTIAHSLALRLAKLLEMPRPRNGASLSSARNRSDVASIPVMLGLLSQKRCRRAYETRAEEKSLGSPLRTSSVSFENEMCLAREAWSEFQASASGRKALVKLQNFRNNILAHILLSQSEDHLPTYAQLFDTYDVVCRVWEQLRAVVGGENWRAKTFTAHHLAEGERFWKFALRGPAQRVTAAPRPGGTDA